MKVAYVVVRENLNDALIVSQVVDVLESLNKNSKSDDDRCDLIWFYRIDTFFQMGFKAFRQVSVELQAKGIRLRPLPFIGGKFPIKAGWLPLMIVQLAPMLCYLSLRFSYKCFHARSYHAGVVVALVSRILRRNFIFDPRSPMPEESVAAGVWKRGSRNFLVWKKLESMVVERSSRTLVTSPFFADLYCNGIAKTKCVVVPNNYPKSFDSQQKVFSKENTSYDFVYVGSFGHWNNPLQYLRFLRDINRISGRQMRCLFVVRGETQRLVHLNADEEGVCSELFDVVSLEQTEIPAALAHCKFGLYFMENDDPRLGVKTTEYLRLGVPVIVSSSIQGAAQVISQNSLGICWDFSADSLKEVMTFVDETATDLELRESCCVFARNNYSAESVGRQLRAVYRSSVVENHEP